ncbi:MULTISPECIES: 3'-5' exonuclease [Actinomycetes]|uniref:DNA 3'-5' helicase n=2 Tax=Actinomycetes TaxID=1760 RepID=A0ABP6LQP5_9MICC
MPFVSMASTKNKVDGSIKKRIYDFLQKLQVDDTAPGLHIEPMKEPQDRRVRTGRVTQEWRAVLYKMEVPGEDAHYVYYGTWHHDEAIRIARSTVLRLNPALGTPEFEDRGAPQTPQEDVAPQQTDLPSGPEAPPETPPEEPTSGESASMEPALEGAAAAGATTATVPWTNALSTGWTADALHEQGGINPDLAARALAATSQAELSAVIDDAPESQGLVLLGLANGETLDHVREDLHLSPVEEGAEFSTDQQVVDAIRRGSAGFAYVGDSDEELRTALESMDIDRWRVFLHPEQRVYAEKSTNGAYRLSGGAGTGKTVVLLHRARHLHRKNPQARILLTTFTKTLTASLAENLRRLDPEISLVGLGEPGVATLGMDQVSAQIVRHASPEEVDAAVERVLGAGRNRLSRRVGKTAELFDAAVERVRPDLPEELTAPAFLDQEYTTVVLAHRITSERDYVRVSRAGRGTALNRAARQQVWKVFAQFRQTNQLDDAATFPELAVIAAQILRDRAERGEPLPVDHVLVDEGQDFHPGHWMLFRALAAEGPDDLFIAEDSHQRIYGQKITLSRYGIHVRGRSRRLRLNYRTTAENLAYAVSLLSGDTYVDMEEEMERSDDYRSVRSGPAPVTIAAADVGEEVAAVAARIRGWLEAGHRSSGIGILVRSEKALTDVIERFSAMELSDRQGPVRLVDARRAAQLRPEEIPAMTMHGAKGMEFECVAVMGVGEQDMPARWTLNRMPEAEHQDVLMRERSVLYVAASRARDELLVTWSGQPSSLLPEM